ncbi:MAG TPA: IspD/TarI family cytidylyltransferase [Nocardioidaceae bacterium]|nr:IspD/TarI family cytidylyltransferase [Nocardioidaceae bacterium]
MSDEQPRAAVVVLAAGSGSRVGHDLNKALLPLGGKPLFAWSLETAAESPHAARVLLVVAERDRSLDEVTAVASRLNAEIVVGGDNRHESERLALESLAADIEGDRLDVVVIHDAARPLATAELLETVIATAHRRGGAVPVRPQPSVIAADDRDRASVQGEFVAVQTPQAFRAGPLLVAYRAAHAQKFVGTDTASCVQAFTDLEVVGVPGSADNLKVTFADDLAVVERLMSLTPGGAERPPGDRPGR